MRHGFQTSLPITIMCLALWAAPPLHAQLAITEVMSAASDSNPLPDSQFPDFWELTNFGPQPVDLSEYRFSDDGGFDGAETNAFQGVILGSGESMIFARRRPAEVIQTVEQFRAWWGEERAPHNLQVAFYPRPGLSDDQDMVQLWRVTATSTALVDRVEFGAARDGVSFTYDPATGEFDAFSALGEGLAFQAALAPDVGSPGYTTGAVPLRFLEQPQPASVDAGSAATFSVGPQGLPKARFQWRFNGTPIPGATSNPLIIPQTVPANAGHYSVELDNGVETRLSVAVPLTINTDPSCARILTPPSDLSVMPGQTATFTVAVRGFPLPAIQWQFEGQNVTGETNTTLRLLDAREEDAGKYTVRVTNALCATNATAVLKVIPKPNLKITEVMISVSTNSGLLGFNDWWELTNDDTNAVSVRDYRWDDLPGQLPGVRILDDVVIEAGESIVLVQEMPRELFVEWWGEENLPEGLQIIRYTGNGFSANGDGIWLWNATPQDRDDVIASIGFVNLDPMDSSVVRGVTQWFDPVLAEFGEYSVLGQRGAIRSAISDDIGSPGYTTNHPTRTLAPKLLGILRDAEGVHLTWKTQVGKWYELQAKQGLDAPGWMPLSQHTAADTQLTMTDVPPAEVARRFYRLEVVIQPP